MGCRASNGILDGVECRRVSSKSRSMVLTSGVSNVGSAKVTRGELRFQFVSGCSTSLPPSKSSAGKGSFNILPGRSSSSESPPAPRSNGLYRPCSGSRNEVDWSGNGVGGSEAGLDCCSGRGDDGSGTGVGCSGTEDCLGTGVGCSSIGDNRSLFVSVSIDGCGLLRGRPRFLPCPWVLFAPGVFPGLAAGVFDGVGWTSDFLGRPLRFRGDASAWSRSSFRGTLVVIVVAFPRSWRNGLLPWFSSSSPSCVASKVTRILHGLELPSSCPFSGDNDLCRPAFNFFPPGDVGSKTSSNRIECALLDALFVGLKLMRWSLPLTEPGVCMSLNVDGDMNRC